MTELSPYFSRSPALSPRDDHVQARSDGQGLADLAVSFEKAQQHLSHVRRENAKTKALLDLSNTMTETDKAWSDYEANIKMDEQDIPKAINSFIDTKIKPHFTKLIQSTSDPDARRGMILHSEEALRVYRTKGFNYESGVRIIRSQSHANSIASNGATSLRLDGSDDNYRKQEALLRQAIDSSPMGLENKIKALNKGLSELAQGQVDHVAFNDSARFKPFFKIESKPGTPLTGKETIEELVDNAPTEIVYPNGNVGGIGGDPCEGWKHLNEAQKHSVIQRLSNSFTAGKREERASVGRELKFAESALVKGVVPEGINDGKLSRDHLMEVYGEERGEQSRDRLETLIAFAPIAAQLITMPSSQADKVLEKLRNDLTASSTTIEMLNKSTVTFNTLKKAHTDSIAELHQDSIKWGVKHGRIPPLRFDTPESFFNSVAHRGSYCKWLEEEHGLKSKFFSDGEEKLFKDQLMRSPAHESVQMYSQAYSQLPEGDKQSVATAYGKFKDHTLASTLSLSTEFSEEAHRSAHTIIVGAKNKSEVEKLYTAHPNSDNKAFDTHFKPLIAKQLSGVQGNSIGRSFERDSEAIKLYIMGDMKETGDYKLSKSRVQDASRAVLGNTSISVNGSSLMPPRGMDHDDFVNRLWFATKSAGEFNPYWSHYTNIGGGRYALVENGNPKVDKDGNPIIINPRDVPTEKILEANKERKQARDLQRAEADMTYNEWSP